MKKILYILLAMFLGLNFSLALEAIDIEAAFSQTSMPSDEEIMKAIENFNINENQKDEIFQETRKQLQMIYSTKTKEELQKTILPEIERINRSLNIEEPILKSNPRISN